MAKTDRLYYTDCALREFEAQVRRVEAAPGGFRVYLDRTAFYPESGGQPTDRGSLEGIPVLEAADEGDEIAHLLPSAPRSDRVKGSIDWARRFDHMQQHTGQHVLSAAFEKTGGYHTVSFHLGAEISSIDLDSDRLGRREIEEAEELANQIVFEDREVRIFFQPAADAQRMDLRKPTCREGDVRLVEIVDFDLSACGGTHVGRTGGVGMIAVRKFERMKAGTRVEFVCGRRALRAARRDSELLSEAARHFSAGFEAVPELVVKQAEQLRESIRARNKLVERLAEATAVELWRTTPEAHGRRTVCRVFSAEDLGEAKRLAHALAARPAIVALIGVKGQASALFFSQSAGGPLNMGTILKETVTKYGGKGGGGRDFAQGGGVDESRLEDALAYAASLLG